MHEELNGGSTGTSPSSTAEDRTAHLRRLRNQVLGDASTALIERTASARSAISAVKERRRSVRFQCSGTVELRTEGSDVRLWGSVTDISLHGCYVEMTTTFPVDTKVSLVIECFGVRVSGDATVRVSYPFLGMGMCFAELEPGQQAHLDQLLRALAGERALLTDPVDAQSGMPDFLASADPQACFDEIVTHFQKSLSLSREEFYQIAKRVRRS